MNCSIQILFTVIWIAMIGCEANEMKDEPEITRDDQGRLRMGNLVVTTQTESSERAALLPVKPTEDARYVLGKIDLPDGPSRDEKRDYLPEPAVSWIVDVRFDGDPPLDPQSISDTFDKKWREKFGGFSDYGRDVETRRWTYLISSDGPKSVDQLKFSFDYIDILKEEAPLPREKLYAARLEQIMEKMKQFGRPTVTASLSPGEAVQRSVLLRDVKRNLDIDAVLILQAPRGKRFDGKVVWDVMLCLGLQWGDMDCFHWPNDSQNGDDYFFSVETSTAPGYFLPEEVAAGRVHVDDLIFVFSVPRCAKPVEVFDGITRAVEYCKSRLGGSIVDIEGTPANITVLRESIIQVTNKLRSAGFEPGANATLQLF